MVCCEKIFVSLIFGLFFNGFVICDEPNGRYFCALCGRHKLFLERNLFFLVILLEGG